MVSASNCARSCSAKVVPAVFMRCTKKKRWPMPTANGVAVPLERASPVVRNLLEFEPWGSRGHEVEIEPTIELLFLDDPVVGRPSLVEVALVPLQLAAAAVALQTGVVIQPME